MNANNLFGLENVNVTDYFVYLGESYSSSLCCPICNDPLFLPVEIKGCRHTFCRQCLETYQDSYLEKTDGAVAEGTHERKHSILCPMCKKTTDADSIGDCECISPIVKNQLDELKVKCTECQREMERQFFPKHFEQSCEYRIVRCPNEKCGQPVVRRELQSHVERCTSQSMPNDLRSETPMMNTQRSPSKMMSPSTASMISTTSSRKSSSFLYAPPTSDNPTYCSGVVFEYYQGEFERLPDFDTMESTYAGVVSGFTISDTTEINVFDKSNGNGERTILDMGNFAVKFTCSLVVAQEGKYTFHMTSNDGSALYIGDKKVVDNGGQHYSKDVSGDIELAVGRYPVSVHFFHRNGKLLEGFRAGPSLAVQYYCPGPLWPLALNSIPLQTIPESALQYNIQDPRIRRVLVDGLNKKCDQKNDLENTSGIGSIAVDPRELQLQLDVCQATIKQLQSALYDSKCSSDLKMQAMRREIEEERSKFTDAVKLLKPAIDFEDAPLKQAAEPNATMKTGSLMAGSEATLNKMPLDFDSTVNPTMNGGTWESLLSEHLSSIDRVKQMYFFSLALSIKMNHQMFGRNVDDRMSSVQDLYERCSSAAEGISIDKWPKYVADHFDQPKELIAVDTTMVDAVETPANITMIQYLSTSPTE